MNEKKAEGEKVVTAEQMNNPKNGAVAATVGKGERRIAHAPNVSIFVNFYSASLLFLLYLFLIFLSINYFHHIDR